MIDVESIRNTIVNGDCLEVMRQLPDACIDLAVTSPPYNLGGLGMVVGRVHKSKKLHIDGYKGYSDCLPHDKYVSWQRDVITEVMRLLKDDGAFFYNHKYFIRKGLLMERHDITDGFPLRQIIIWYRCGAGTNFTPTHFLPTYENIYLIAKKDYHLAKGKNKYSDMWSIPCDGKNTHPAPFHVEIPRRAIESSLCMERDGAIVLDPFMGSGTTAVAAAMLGKDYVGIEQSAEYCEMARKRISETCVELGFKNGKERPIP